MDGWEGGPSLQRVDFDSGLLNLCTYVFRRKEMAMDSEEEEEIQSKKSKNSVLIILRDSNGTVLGILEDDFKKKRAAHYKEVFKKA